MKTVKDVMTADVVWVSPSARVKTAIILMKGHNIGALPVVSSNDEVIGLATYQSLLGASPDTAVMDVMESEFVGVDPDLDVREAAEAMRRSGAGHLLVMHEGRLLGMVSHGDLIAELGRNFDPLTGMPWSDSLREWAVDALKRGLEISVILFDLDDFGKFNKQYSHPVGDRVLKEVAEVFKTGVDPDIELACRYAGDEFGIVSTRSADAAVALAETLKERISQVSVPEAPEQVSGSYGLAGGRRTREREDVHYVATVDDLITRASRNCIAAKRQKVEEEAAPPRPEPGAPSAPALDSVEHAGRRPRLKIQAISISTTETEVSVSVTLTREGREFTRQAGGYAVGGTNTLRLVAEAAAGAACKSLAPRHGIVVDEVLAHDIGPEEEIVTVVVLFVTPRSSTRHVGSAVVKRGDRFRAVVAALLSAVNRQIESVPHAEPEHPEEPEAPQDAPQSGAPEV